jgi:enoyl-CoA hydratase/carnithine racemase
MTDINIAQKDNVLSLTLCRAEKKNALTRQMYLDMANAIHYAQKDDHTLAILIQGSEGCFTAGNDLSDFVAASQQEDTEVAETEQFMLALMQCTLPVVAKVEGLAIGIGTTLLLHCDFVYARDDAQFMMPFINLGLVPEYASSYLVPKLVGHARAAEWLMLGEGFSAQDAYTAGLVNRVLPASELDDKVNQVLAKLVTKPKMALLQTKQLLKHDQHVVSEHMYSELKLFVNAMRSDAAKEAFSAFLEKRQPDLRRFA